jgi:hypothetical protein
MVTSGAAVDTSGTLEFDIFERDSGLANLGFEK